MTRVVVPAIGLFAVTGALALVALAPVVLFSSSNEAGPLPSAPAASSEVASVTATRFRPQPPASQATANETPEAPGEPSAGGQLVAISPVGGVEGDTAGKAVRRPAARDAGPAVEEPAQPGHPGKAKGKAKDKVGKAKGHAKPNAHGKAREVAGPHRCSVRSEWSEARSRQSFASRQALRQERSSSRTVAALTPTTSSRS
jgi:hypothetical protein